MSPSGRAKHVVLLGAALAASGCQSRSLAKETLEKDGLTEIELTKNGDSFDFVAKKKDKKQVCAGAVSAKSYGFKQEVQTTSFCHDDESACPEDPSICWRLGDAAAERNDLGKAAQLYEKGCGADSGASCTNLGVAYEKAKGVEASLERAMELWEKGCKLGSTVGCMNAAGKLDGGAVKADPPRLASLLSAACKLQNDDACFFFAMKQYNGAGVEKNEVEAGKTVQALCDKGVQKACGPLGLFKLMGSAGMSKDEAAGRALMLTACENDDEEACANLAVLGRERKLPPDLTARAGSFAERACNKDNANGCLELGLALERGLGGKTRDLAGALAAQEKACGLGSAVGCFNVGFMQERGLGTPRDVDASKVAYAKACTLGHRPACNH